MQIVKIHAELFAELIDDAMCVGGVFLKILSDALMPFSHRVIRKIQRPIEHGGCEIHHKRRMDDRHFDGVKVFCEAK